MFRIVSILAAVVCFQFTGLTTASFSQTPKAQQNVARSNSGLDLDRLTRELDLTVSQQNRIRAIQGKYSPRGVRKAQRIKGEDIRKRLELYNSEVRKVLTPEQRKKYNPQLPPEGTPMAPLSEELQGMMMERFAREYNLSADQQAKIKALYGEIFLETIRPVASAPDQDIQGNDVQGDQRKRIDLMNAEIRKTLTPKQKTKFDALTASRKEGK